MTIFETDYIFRNKKCILKFECAEATSHQGLVCISADLNSYSGLTNVVKSASNNPDLQFFFFTDDASVQGTVFPKNLIVCKVMQASGDSRLLAKRFKIDPFSIFRNCQSVIWFDANLELSPGLSSLLVEARKYDALFFAHDKRSSVQQEVGEILKHAKDDRTILAGWMHLLRDRSYIDDELLQGRFFYLKNCERVRKFTHAWWETVLSFSIRDQTSLPVVLRENCVKYLRVKSERTNDVFSLRPHTKYLIGRYDKTFYGAVKASMSKLRYKLYTIREKIK